jgi:hypothetical protein
MSGQFDSGCLSVVFASKSLGIPLGIIGRSQNRASARKVVELTQNNGH